MSRVLFLALVAIFAWPDSVSSKDEPKPKTDAELIQGEWRYVHVEEEGDVAPLEELKGLTLKIEGDKATVMKDGKVLKPGGTFVLDLTKDPKQINLKEKGESDALGIYKLEGDQLLFCAERGGGKMRPKEFKTGPKSGTELFKLERIKK